MGYFALNIMVNSLVDKMIMITLFYLPNQDGYATMDAIIDNDGF